MPFGQDLWDLGSPQDWLSIGPIYHTRFILLSELHELAGGNEYAFTACITRFLPRGLSKPLNLRVCQGTLLEICTFEDIDGKTKLTKKSVYESVEDRDGMLKSGMEEGTTETMDSFA